MSETHKSFTPEQRITFEEKYNLGVYNHEALIELLMQQDKRIQQLEELIGQLVERQERFNARLKNEFSR